MRQNMPKRAGKAVFGDRSNELVSVSAKAVEGVRRKTATVKKVAIKAGLGPQSELLRLPTPASSATTTAATTTSSTTIGDESFKIESTPPASLFPVSRTALWARTPTGPPISLSLGTVSLIMHTPALQLLLNEARVQSSNSIAGRFLIGSLELSPESRRATLRLDRYDPGRTGSGITNSRGSGGGASASSDSAAITDGVPTVPTVCIPGDIAVALGTGPALIAGAAESIANELEVACGAAGALDTSRLLAIRGACTLTGAGPTLKLDIELHALVPGTTFHATPVEPLPVHAMPAAVLLGGGNGFGGDSTYFAASEMEAGFVTLNAQRRAILLTHDDPRVATRPIVGVWTSGAPVTHPFVWATCLRFLHSKRVRDRATMPKDCFLLVVCAASDSKDSAAPLFFECCNGTPAGTPRAEHLSAAISFKTPNHNSNNEAVTETIYADFARCRSGPEHDAFVADMGMSVSNAVVAEAAKAEEIRDGASADGGVTEAFLFNVADAVETGTKVKEAEKDSVSRAAATAEVHRALWGFTMAKPAAVAAAAAEEEETAPALELAEEEKKKVTLSATPATGTAADAPPATATTTTDSVTITSGIEDDGPRAPPNPSPSPMALNRASAMGTLHAGTLLDGSFGDPRLALSPATSPERHAENTEVLNTLPAMTPVQVPAAVYSPDRYTESTSFTNEAKDQRPTENMGSLNATAIAASALLKLVTASALGSDSADPLNADSVADSVETASVATDAAEQVLRSLKREVEELRSEISLFRSRDRATSTEVAASSPSPPAAAAAASSPIKAISGAHAAANVDVAVSLEDKSEKYLAMEPPVILDASVSGASSQMSFMAAGGADAVASGMDLLQARLRGACGEEIDTESVATEAVDIQGWGELVPEYGATSTVVDDCEASSSPRIARRPSAPRLIAQSASGKGGAELVAALTNSVGTSATDATLSEVFASSPSRWISTALATPPSGRFLKINMSNPNVSPDVTLSSSLLPEGTVSTSPISCHDGEVAGETLGSSHQRRHRRALSLTLLPVADTQTALETARASADVLVPTPTTPTAPSTFAFDLAAAEKGAWTVITRNNTSKAPEAPKVTALPPTMEKGDKNDNNVKQDGQDLTLDALSSKSPPVSTVAIAAKEDKKTKRHSSPQVATTMLSISTTPGDRVRSLLGKYLGEEAMLEDAGVATAALTADTVPTSTPTATLMMAAPAESSQISASSSLTLGLSLGTQDYLQRHKLTGAWTAPTATIQEGKVGSAANTGSASRLLDLQNLRLLSKLPQ